jgi:hypothetical protein
MRDATRLSLVYDSNSALSPEKSPALPVERIQRFHPRNDETLDVLHSESFF